MSSDIVRGFCEGWEAPLLLFEYFIYLLRVRVMIVNRLMRFLNFRLKGFKMYLSKEIIERDAELCSYLLNAVLKRGNKGGVFVGTNNIAPTSLRTYGIILPRGGMIIPEMKLEALTQIVDDIKRGQRKIEEDRSDQEKSQFKAFVAEGNRILGGANLSLDWEKAHWNILYQYQSLKVVGRGEVGDSEYRLYRVFSNLTEVPDEQDRSHALAEIQKYLMEYEAVLLLQKANFKKISELVQLVNKNANKSAIGLEYAALDRLLSDNNRYRPMKFSHWIVLAMSDLEVSFFKNDSGDIVRRLSTSNMYFDYTEEGLEKLRTVLEFIYSKMDEMREIAKSQPDLLSKNEDDIVHPAGLVRRSIGGDGLSEWPVYRTKASVTEIREYYFNDIRISKQVYDWLKV